MVALVNVPARGVPLRSSGLRFLSQRSMNIRLVLLKFTAGPAACRFTLRPTKGAIFYDPLSKTFNTEIDFFEPILLKNSYLCFLDLKESLLMRGFLAPYER